MVRLGDKVRDLVTGMEGIATSRTEWLNGCVRIGIEFARKDRDGNAETARETFDEEQMEVVERGVVTPMTLRSRRAAAGRTTGRVAGGDRPEPSRR